MEGSLNAVPGIEADRVTAWFVEHIDGVKPPLRFELISGGRSNLTYKVTDRAGQMYVLRRPPLGHVLESAHDVGREYRILRGVGRTAVPVPAALGWCADSDVNAAPFYVMNYIDGLVLAGQQEAVALPPAERASLGRAVADTLACLHRVDPDAIGLGELGRKQDYIGRQLRRWSKQWENSRQRELPIMEEVHAALARAIPAQPVCTIVHGDYRLGNMLVRDGRILAVLDWELCTLGDPLADVAFLVNNWIDPGEAIIGAGTPTGAGGFGTREDLLARYQAGTGFDLSRIDYFRAFSHWRLAVISEGIYARYRHGAMADATSTDPDEFRKRTEVLAQAAQELLAQQGVI